MATKVSDTFTEASNTALNAHTPDTDTVGGGWSDSGTMTVVATTDNLSASAINDGGWIDGGITDQDVEYDFNAGGADNRTSISARSGSTRRASNGAQPNDGYTCGFRIGNNDIVIFKIVSGTPTQIGSGFSFTFNNSTTYNFKYKVNGSTLEAFVDDVSQGSETDSSITVGGYAGLYHNLFTNGAARYDNFLLQDVAVAGTILPFMMHY